MTDPLKLSAAELGHTFEINQNDPVKVVEAFFDSIKAVSYTHLPLPTNREV